MKDHKDIGTEIQLKIPVAVRQILDTLHRGGYEAYVVGGCVRDTLLGREPEDWDVTTSALPQAVKALFPHTVDTGIQHGTVMVLKQGCGYEVTTYRVDGEYQDSRHPSKVTFTRSLQEDLKRRDFTINAFAWGEEGVIDLFDGMTDLKDGVIRCVGDPDQRFQEDALRIMRAVRFSAQLGFVIEQATGQMIQKHAPRLEAISMERIRVEWEKTLLSDHPDMVNRYADYGIAPYIVKPGYERCFQEKRNALLLELSRRRQTVQTGEGDPDWCDADRYRVLLLAAFFLDLSADETNQALRYLKYDNQTRTSVVSILRHLEDPRAADLVAVKQAMNRMGKDTWISILELQNAKNSAEAAVAADVDLTKELIHLTRKILASGEPWNLSQLAINGSDLIRAGFAPGEKIGEMLEKILQKVIQSPTLNRKELLCDSIFLEEVEYDCKRGV